MSSLIVGACTPPTFKTWLTRVVVGHEDHACTVIECSAPVQVKDWCHCRHQLRHQIPHWMPPELGLPVA